MSFLFRVNIIWDDLFHENVTNNLYRMCSSLVLISLHIHGVYVLNCKIRLSSIALPTINLEKQFLLEGVDNETRRTLKQYAHAE